MATIIWTLTPTAQEITLPSGNNYFLSDAEVRNWIGSGELSGAEYRITELESAVETLQNATHWLGITTTTLSDGATTNPITIAGESVTAVSGDIVQDSEGTEFIFNGTTWQQFGASIGVLKSFAFVDTGTVTITPTGSNSSSSVSFSGGSDGKLVKTTVPNVTSVGSAASWSATVNDEVLTFAWTPDVVPSLGTAIEVATGSVASDGTGDTVVTAVGTGTAAAQTFTGTQTTHTVYPTAST